MMSEPEALALIANRIEAVQDSANSTHIEHNIGVIRGLVWVISGKDPGASINSVAEVAAALRMSFEELPEDSNEQSGVEKPPRYVFRP